MENKVAKIGILKFKNYSESVIIDSNFNIDDLYHILDNDSDAVSFSVYEGDECLLYITGTVVVSKEEEVIGTTFNAFVKNPYSYKKRITWKLSSGGYQTSKKKAQDIADFENKKNRKILENLKLNIYRHKRD